MKYIMFKSGDVHTPVIFPDSLVHKDVADALFQHCGLPVSAGFLSSTGLETNCHGMSETLNLSSRAKFDDDMIVMRDYNSGLIGGSPTPYNELITRIDKLIGKLKDI